jgi:chemotaxis protein CheX
MGQGFHDAEAGHAKSNVQNRCEGSMTEPILLPARLDLAAVALLTEDMAARLTDGKIVLDGRDITHMGALCAQAILSAARTVIDAGGSLEFTDLSDRAVQQLSCMGLTPNMLTEGAR